MPSLSTTHKKKSIKATTSRDVRRTSGVRAQRTAVTSRVHSLNTIVGTSKLHKRAPLITINKGQASHLTRKVKRYAKQGVKSMLLSPLFHSTFKIISIALVSSGLIYASYFFIGKTFANEVVVSQSEIVARVGKLTLLPFESPYEVVRVQDEEDLRKQNSFYKDIKEGDYVLMYRDLAVIYDLRNNVIKGVRRSGDR
jgi:hypothetical protein